jgi:hypothetical protein
MLTTAPTPVQRRIAPFAPMPRPWVRFRKLPGGVWETTLTVQTGPGVYSTWSAQVAESTVRAALRQQGIEVGSIFSKIAKGVSKIAKITGVDKVLKVASLALNNPLVRSAIPGLGTAAKALQGARGILVAHHALKEGTPEARQAAKKALLFAQAKIEGGDVPTQHAAALATRIYKLAVLPQ